MRVRAVFVIAIACGLIALACGGEKIRYGATPTASPRLDLAGPTDEQFAEWIVRARAYQAFPSVSNETQNDFAVRIIEKRDWENVSLAQALRSWQDAVGNGATSRADLIAICSERGASITDEQPATPARTICAGVREEARSMTLRQWADLIDVELNQLER